jgi:hypothetical protein
MKQYNISIKLCGMHATDSTIRLVIYVYSYMKLYINVNKLCDMHAADSTIRLVTFVYVYMNQ